MSVGTILSPISDCLLGGLIGYVGLILHPLKSGKWVYVRLDLRTNGFTWAHSIQENLILKASHKAHEKTMVGFQVSWLSHHRHNRD